MNEECFLHICKFTDNLSKIKKEITFFKRGKKKIKKSEWHQLPLSLSLRDKRKQVTVDQLNMQQKHFFYKTYASRHDRDSYIKQSLFTLSSLHVTKQNKQVAPSQLHPFIWRHLHRVALLQHNRDS